MRLRVDETKLRASLERLPRLCRIAFAAACAERQFPNYVKYSSKSGRGDPHALKKVLNCLWRDLEEQAVAREELHRQLSLAISLQPGEDDLKFFDDCLYAEDAAVAATYAIEARLTSNMQEVIWAAERPREALSHYIRLRLDPDIGDWRKQLEQVISDPLYQAELHRQQQDLSELGKKQGHRDSGRSAISVVHQRAKADAAVFFNREAAVKDLAERSKE